MNSKKPFKRKHVLVRRVLNAVAHIFNIPIVATYDPIEERDERLGIVGWNTDNYMIDFRPGRMNNTFSINNTSIMQGVQGVGINMESPKEQTIKVAVKPKDVLNELERLPTKWSLEGLDEKIAMMQDKIKLIQQSQTKQEAEVLLVMLKNRKKYFDKAADGQIFWQYFSQFDSTHDGNIKKLLDKHDLVMEPADIFIPEFPNDASTTMISFAVKFEELTGKKPRFYVIATQESFKKNYEKRDPILLAQSPFGFYYHILGAWDDEMLYLPEL
jgi:hypothetical protein